MASSMVSGDALKTFFVYVLTDNYTHGAQRYCFLGFIDRTRQYQPDTPNIQILYFFIKRSHFVRISIVFCVFIDLEKESYFCSDKENNWTVSKFWQASLICSFL